MPIPKIQEQKKRVKTLYRVSTAGQADDLEIPMQQNACKEFIERNGWELVEECVEIGISGYSKSLKDRDKLRKLLYDAECGSYDVLLVFMFDRLGRKDDETPFIVEQFVGFGIEVWSVIEGQQRFDNHTDKLLNYLRYWQSSGESIKTSIRVNEKHTQMVRAGEFRGGTAPYGYRLVSSGVLNKKGKDLLKIEIDDVEAEVIRKIFAYAYEEGFGGNRIARALNESKLHQPRNSSSWSSSVINYIIRNPIYKGYYSYGKTTSKIGVSKREGKVAWTVSDQPNRHLEIVKENVWDGVQVMRGTRNPFGRPEIHEEGAPQKQSRVFRTTKSPLLLIGLIKCGYCGHPLTTTYQVKKYTTKKGKTTEYRKAMYRCTGKSLSVCNCEGQTTYSQVKIEGAVLDEVKAYLTRLKEINLKSEIDQFRKVNVSKEVIESKRIKKQLIELGLEKEALSKEVAKSLLKKSKFQPELLSELIRDKAEEIVALERHYSEVLRVIEQKQLELRDLERVQQYIPIWTDELEKVTSGQKKIIIASIIENILVSKDTIEINIRLSFDEFFGLQNTPMGERAWLAAKRSGVRSSLSPP